MLNELKAQAYDCIAQMEALQGKLNGINQQIAKLISEEKVEVKEEQKE